MTSTYCPRAAELTSVIVDALNFEGTSFWDPDPTTGVGGLGDPNDDYRVPSGGFATGFSLSYPLPHRLRRRPATSLGNSLNQITPENVAALVNGFAGTFIGFQVALENGPHFTVHGLVGGCVDLTASWSRPLTGHTQGSRGAVPRKRPR